ncbi:MAG: BMP family ABC transporter substrate-binding protein, partial [Sphaerochaetaceae bacterium]|nr:BMP family ABC transporter substrate-binding protein [Sphaerochaetaceae bacterium]
YGTRVALGINEDCVGLADNEVYQKKVPSDVRELMASYTEKIRKGEIKVDTAFGKSKAEINKYIETAR